MDNKVISDLENGKLENDKSTIHHLDDRYKLYMMDKRVKLLYKSFEYQLALYTLDVADDVFCLRTNQQLTERGPKAINRGDLKKTFLEVYTLGYNHRKLVEDNNIDDKTHRYIEDLLQTYQ